MDATLSGVNTAESVRQDAQALLATWNFTDDAQLPWREDQDCTHTYRVSRDETAGSAPVAGVCWWTPPQYQQTGAILGTPYNPQPSRPGDHWPDGAAVIWENVSRVRVQKWAQIKSVHLSHNFCRPCGEDRFDERFPNAWAICGCVDVVSATQNGALVNIQLASPAFLQAGDHVDFVGVGSLGGDVLVVAVN